MKPIKFFVLVVVLILLLAFLYDNIDQERTVVYDCGMAEWHPDIPVAVKEECRNLRLKKMI
jgi:hypothetical protein